MATFIALIDFTTQGLAAIQQSPERADALAAKAEAAGLQVKSVYWTMGAHDGVLVFDAPDDAAASAFILTLAKAGNVRAHTLRAYDRSEFSSLLDRVE